MNLKSYNHVSDKTQLSDEFEPTDQGVSLPPDPPLQQAQLHNIDALTTLMGQKLAEHNLKVADLAFKRETLMISVESVEVPEQSVTVPLLQNYLSQLQLSSVTTAIIYGQKLGQELPFWMEEIKLDGLMLDPPVVDSHSSIQGGDSSDLSQSEPVSSDIARELTSKYAAGERNFAQINLKDEALPGINLTLTDLHEANLVWCDLRKASLSHANLTSALLRHANLQNANLQGAKLQGTDLRGAKLKGANLSWAVLRGTNLTDADLTDVNFQNATLERVIMPDGTILD